MKQMEIPYFTTRNETKCSVVEWFNRTLKKECGNILPIKIHGYI